MALIDVTDLLGDPDFVDSDAQLIRRTVTINSFGENVITEAAPVSIVASIQAGAGQQLDRLPESARLRDFITVYCDVQLTAESVGGYCDVIVWDGARWLVQIVTDYHNYGAGYFEAVCIKEVPNNG